MLSSYHQGHCHLPHHSQQLQSEAPKVDDHKRQNHLLVEKRKGKEEEKKKRRKRRRKTKSGNQHKISRRRNWHLFHNESQRRRKRQKDRKRERKKSTTNRPLIHWWECQKTTQKEHKKGEKEELHQTPKRKRRSQMMMRRKRKRRKTGRNDDVWVAFGGQRAKRRRMWVKDEHWEKDFEEIENLTQQQRQWKKKNSYGHLALIHFAAVRRDIPFHFAQIRSFVRSSSCRGKQKWARSASRKDCLPIIQFFCSDESCRIVTVAWRWGDWELGRSERSPKLFRSSFSFQSLCAWLFHGFFSVQS